MISRILRKVALGPADGLMMQVPRALAVSILAMLVDVSLLMILVAVCSLPAIPAAVLSYLTGVIVQYVLCSIWVFPTAGRGAAGGFALFALLSLGGLGLTAGTIELLHEIWGTSLGLAKCFALGLAFVWNFGTRKFLLFRSEALPQTVAE